MLSYLNIQTCFVLKFFRYMPLSEEKTNGIVSDHLNSEDNITIFYICFISKPVHYVFVNYAN